MSDPSEGGGPSAGAEPRKRLMERLKSAFGLRREASLRADLEGALAEDQLAEAQGQVFSPEERAMLRNILGLREVRVADVMVPRAEIVAVEHDISLGDLLRSFREAAHSRLPVYRETLDDPVGFVHIRDFLTYLTTGAPRKSSTGRRKKSEDLDLGKIDLATPLSAAKIARRVLFVPPSMPALDLLVQMQASHVHLALVIDEYGGTDGLVSIEDLIEEVVGEIEDEHDEDERVITRTAEGWVANARASLEEVRAALQPELSLDTPAELEEEIDTLGGLLVTLAGRVPSRGELIRGPGLVEFEVLDADPRRVKRVRIRKTSVVDAAPRERPPRRRAREAGLMPADQPTEESPPNLAPPTSEASPSEADAPRPDSPPQS